MKVRCRSKPRTRRPDRAEYGRQKALVESRLRGFSGNICIVRFAKVWGPRTPLLTRWASDLRCGKAIRPLADLMVAPVPLDFAVEVLRRVGSTGLRGILQASGPQEVSYAAVARHLADRLGADPRLVEPVPVIAAGLKIEHLPAHTTLDISRLRDELKLEPPDVWTTIDSALKG